jgi:hypothetical protein
MLDVGGGMADVGLVCGFSMNLFAIKRFFKDKALQCLTFCWPTLNPGIA